MGLETVTNIADLVRTNPTSSDPKSQGDDHLRNIKTALLNNLVGFPGAIMVTGTDGGAVNAYTLTPAYGTFIAYGNRMVAVFSPTITNTGASTLNISGLGAKDVKSVSGAALVANDLTVGSIYAAFYNGTEFRLLSITKNYADQLAFSAALPALSLGFLRSDGATAAFTTTHTGYAQNEVKSADIASAATINLDAATGNLVHVTGTTTITAITLASGAEREIVFDGVLTLTHNATTLILPTGANITTAAGDCATVRGDGTGNVRVVKYERASGQSLITPAMRLLANLTPTAAANVDFLSIFSSTYDDYLIIFDGIKPAADDQLNIRYAVAGSVVTTNNYFGSDVNVSATAAAFLSVTTSTVLASGTGMLGEISVQNANHATQVKGGKMSTSQQTNATPTFIGSSRWSAFNGGVVTGFRLYWGAGSNFSAQGSVKVFGIVKT